MSTKTSTPLDANPVTLGGTPKRPTLGAGPWRTRAALIAGFVGVGVLGVAIGRGSSVSPGTQALPAPPQSASAPARPAGERPKFDLAEVPGYHSGVELRPMDHDIFDKLVNLNLERTQMPDVFPDRPYRVAFIGSLAERRINVVMVDLDRDGKMDERWELKKGDLVRTVPKDPAAQGQAVKYTLTHGRWQPH